VILFVLADFGFGGITVASGSPHDFTLPSPRQVCYGLGVTLSPVATLGEDLALKLRGIHTLFELQGEIFFCSSLAFATSRSLTSLQAQS
jgi:hypothetical protein